MKKSIKRTLSLLLALTMVLSLGLPAYAINIDDVDREEETFESIEEPIGAKEFEVPEEGTEKEELRPAAEFSFVGEDGFAVAVSAPDGALPLGAEMHVNRLADLSDVQAAVDSAANLQGDVRLAADISFWLDDQEVEPAEGTKLLVRMSAPEIEGIAEPVVVHLPDGENAAPEIVEQLGSSDVLMSDTIAFEANSFSVYAVVDPGQTGDYARLTVNFWRNADDEEPIATIYVKTKDQSDDDAMELIVYDPGVGEMDPKQVFKGWYLTSDFTAADAEKGLTIAKVREHIKGLTIHEGDTIDFYAMIFYAYRVTYLDQVGAAIESQTLYSLDSAAISYKVDHEYTPKDQDEKFEGWKIVGDETGTVYPNGSMISISENTTFKASVPKGAWLMFKENGKGATYTAPQFIPSGGKTTQPANPSRRGYTFAGWYLNAEGTGSAFTAWNQTLSESTTLYAKWNVASSADYTVVIWQQHVDDDKYDFKESIQASGTPNTTISFTAHNTGNTDVRDDYISVGNRNVQYTGFHFDEYDQNVTIAPEGNTVINVYYDRNLYTYTFIVANSNFPSGYDSYGSGNYYISNYNNTTVVQTVTRRYQASIKDIWEFRGSNGINYPHKPTSGYYTYLNSWTPARITGSGNAQDGFAQRVAHLEMMEAADRSYYVLYTRNTTKHLHYYVEAPEGTTGATRTYDGKTYVEYYDLECDFNYVTPSEIWALEGYSFVDVATNGGTVVTSAVRGNGNNGISWENLNSRYSANNTLYFYYTREAFPIVYRDGIYVDKDGNKLNETNQGILKTGDEIPFGDSLTSHANDYLTTATEAHPAHPITAGYVFAGWYLDDACNTPFSFDGATMPKAPLTLYAKWNIIQYRTFLHPMVTEAEDSSLSLGGAATSFALNYGATVTEPTAIRDDYEIIGWYRDEAHTDPWKFSFEGNDTNITTAYDKTEPTELTTPYATVDTSEYPANYNKDKAENRFWITRKLDLYAWWRYKLVGADGINVEYCSNGFANVEDEEGNVSKVEVSGTFAVSGGETTTIWPDPVLYLDQATGTTGSIASAPTPDDAETYVFKQWVLQTWDKTKNEYVDTDLVFLPGGEFPVLATYAKVTENPDSTEENPSYTYMIRIRAEYAPIEEEIPTHIDWYANNGSGDVQENKGISINESVDIPTPSNYTPTNGRRAAGLSYEGYTFIGWAKIENDANAGGTAVREFSYSDLFLRWIADNSEAGGYYQAKIGDTWTNVEEVAADEYQPYEDLYAVWVKEFYVYHTGTNKVERFMVSAKDETNGAATFDLTELVNRDEFLYGGYYKGYAGAANLDVAALSFDPVTEASSLVTTDGVSPSEALTGLVSGQMVASAEYTAGQKYITDLNSSTAFAADDAYDVAGNAMTPKSGEVYYIKEVPIADFLQPRVRYTYKDSGDKPIGTTWLFTNADDANYDYIGIVINGQKYPTNLVESYTITALTTNKSVTYTVSSGDDKIFNKGARMGAVVVYNNKDLLPSGYTPGADEEYLKESFNYLANGAVTYFWVTPDGMIVTGQYSRTYSNVTNAGGTNPISISAKSDALASTINLYGSGS